MLKAAFYTLGCRLNQTESAIMAKGLENAGYLITQDLKNADLCVINTCTVTNQSDIKCRRKIRAIQRGNPEAVIAVVGCFSQISSRQILDIGGVDLILGNQEKLNLPEYLSQAKESSQPIVNVAPISKTPFAISTIGQYLGSTRANLKIQDGCDFVCSFCIIPSARGRSRPREIENIRREVIDLAEAGVQEIVLTGVNIGTYEYENTGFIDLLDLFEKIDGIRRVRISSIEPTTVGPEIFALMKDWSSKLVPYLHLPLQSANNDILKKMRRRYLFEEFRDFVVQAVDEVPQICIGSDVIVGFPGETEEMFEETVSALQQIPVHYFHVFPYAERKGTKSEKLTPKNPGNAISRRAAVLRKLSDQKREEFVRRFRGEVLEVLFEGNDGGDRWQGYSQNYIRVSVTSEESMKNRIRSVEVLSSDGGRAFGQLRD
ncbi:MAG: tRNA (N(6)-L-threonylcarbamoyladenosine(37)-C(2))-methylthiotransferase MtaB [Proteobacteria bacterium]|nr:tRNA (N(6)-L-threonylcarbamoyladenosine(37)-C(2))-methylthiotransferase MtaB [Pseudomonadota bacterium]